MSSKSVKISPTDLLCIRYLKLMSFPQHGSVTLLLYVTFCADPDSCCSSSPCKPFVFRIHTPTALKVHAILWAQFINITQKIRRWVVIWDSNYVRYAVNKVVSCVMVGMRRYWYPLRWRLKVLKNGWWKLQSGSDTQGSVEKQGCG